MKMSNLMSWAGAGRSRVLAAFLVGGLFAVSPLANAASGTGLTGEYFSYRNLSFREMVRVDKQVNFNWGSGGPSAATGSDTFSVRWSGSIEVPSSQTYTFYTYSDDGVRLYVNGKQIINNWTDHSAIENKGSISLQAGRRYDIKLEYYDNTGSAVIQLRWSSPQLAKQLVPQLYLYPTSASAPQATPAPTPVATPVPATPTPVPPASGYVRPYSSKAAWNIPVKGLPLNGTNYNNMLWNGAADRPGNFNINNYESFAIYYSDKATISAQVNTQWSTNVDGTKVPWNPAWKVPAGSDKKVVILDTANGREWNFWQTKFDGLVLQAVNGSLVPGSFYTSMGVNPPSRGVGIAYYAMLVRAVEIQNGVIPHALAQSINNTDGSTYVAPATKLEHPGRGPGIPEGTRFALRITDAEIEAWVKKLPAASQRAGRIIAVALRDYGWFVTDTGGNGAFEFEDVSSAGSAWSAVGMGNAQDMLDGLMTADKIYTIAPSDKYP